MSYDNSTLIITEVSGTWRTATGFSYGSVLDLIPGIPHEQQVQILRPDLADNLSPDRGASLQLTIEDRRSLSVIPIEWCTFDEDSFTITAITPPDEYLFTLESGDVIDIQDLAPFEDGETITVKRKSVSNQPFVEWTAGSKFTGPQLNLSNSQLLNLLQEILYELRYNCIFKSDRNATDGPLFTDIDIDLNLGGHKILNLGAGSDTTDAANMQNIADCLQSAKDYADGLLVGWDPGDIPFVYTEATNTVSHLATGSQGDFFKWKTSGGTTVISLDNKFRLSAGAKIFYGASEPTGTQAPIDSADSSATGLLWYDSSTGILKTWTNYGAGSYSWQSVNVVTGVDLSNPQTISGVKTFSGGIALSSSAVISGSGASKTIVIAPTNSGSTAQPKFTFSATSGFIIDGTVDIVMDLSGNISCNNITAHDLTLSGSLNGVTNLLKVDGSVDATGTQAFTATQGITAKAIRAYDAGGGVRVLRLGTTPTSGTMTDGLVIDYNSGSPKVTCLSNMEVASGKTLNVLGSLQINGQNVVAGGSALTPYNSVGWTHFGWFKSNGTTSLSQTPSAPWTLVTTLTQTTFYPTSGTWTVIVIYSPWSGGSSTDTTAYTIATGVTGQGNSPVIQDTSNADKSSGFFIAVRTA